MISTNDYKNLPDKPDDFAGRSIWIYCQAGGDERVGLLISARNGEIAIGYCYGSSSLTWKKLQ